jgi:hypothetical protein
MPGRQYSANEIHNAAVIENNAGFIGNARQINLRIYLTFHPGILHCAVPAGIQIIFGNNKSYAVGF